MLWQLLKDQNLLVLPRVKWARRGLTLCVDFFSLCLGSSRGFPWKGLQHLDTFAVLEFRHEVDATRGGTYVITPASHKYPSGCIPETHAALPTQLDSRKLLLYKKQLLYYRKVRALIATPNGKLGDMCEDIWHVLTRDSQCHSVQPVSLVVFWTDQKPHEVTSQLSLKSIRLSLSHSGVSIRAPAEPNLIYWGWFWIFFGKFRPLLWSRSHFVM